MPDYGLASFCLAISRRMSLSLGTAFSSTILESCLRILPTAGPGESPNSFIMSCPETAKVEAGVFFSGSPASHREKHNVLVLLVWAFCQTATTALGIGFTGSDIGSELFPIILEVIEKTPQNPSGESSLARDGGQRWCRATDLANSFHSGETPRRSETCST